MLRKNFFHLVLFCFLLLPTAAVMAAVPAILSYKGMLVDTLNQPDNGSRTFVFNLYTVETGGSAFWTETQTIDVASGQFTTQFGAVPANPLDLNQFTGDTWLGIAVSGAPEMTPRQKMTSVPYAARAAVAESVDNTDSLNPAGGIMAFGGTAAPAGWLMCDGSAVSRTTYARLFDAIGTAHGSGDGSTTFNLPDYRGRFLRGVDGVAGRDADKASRAAMNLGANAGNTVGSVQGDSFRAHNHPANGVTNGGGLWQLPTANNIMVGDPNYSVVTENSGILSRGGSETRPVNAYVNWIIKY